MNDHSRKIRPQSDGQSLMAGVFRSDDILVHDMFPSMRADEESLVAKCDTLICEMGRRCLKSHKEKHLFPVVMRHMKRLTRLLIGLRKDIPIYSLLEALRPQYFDEEIVQFDSISNTYKSPSYALQIGTILK